MPWKSYIMYQNDVLENVFLYMLFRNKLIIIIIIIIIITQLLTYTADFKLYMVITFKITYVVITIGIAR